MLSPLRCVLYLPLARCRWAGTHYSPLQTPAADSSATHVEHGSREELLDLQRRIRAIGDRADLVLPPNPHPSSPSNGAGAEGDRAVTNNTLALLVGWMNSTPKALKKYASIYTELGVPVVCFAPYYMHMWSDRVSSGVSRKILSAMKGSLSSPTSIILHLFSGACGVLLPEAVKEYSDPESVLRSKGVLPSCAIFDSGPVEFSNRSGKAGAKLILKQGGINYVSYLTAVGMGITVEKLIGKRKRRRERRVLASDLLQNIPILGLYSESDIVMLPSNAREFVSEQRSMGRDVASHFWKDSEHVRHFMSHPEEYREKIVRFLKHSHVLQ